jgi:serine/threonine protein kinase
VNSSACIDRSGQSSFSFDIKPDVCVYTQDSGRRELTDVARTELAIEFKWHSGDDPFCSPYLISDDEDDGQSFLRGTKGAIDTAGQITAYAAAQLGSQFRTCIYSVLIVKSYARLIRWDRTGAVVSQPIQYNQQPELAEFLRRYYKAPPKVRGVDTTVTIPTIDEKHLARKCLEISDDWPLLKMTVPTPNSHREYVIRAPIANHYTPPGRATRGFVAYDIERRTKVYLKDTWRVDLPGIEREGETYKLLWEAHVRNLALCSAAGDIEGHHTLTHIFQNEPWACRVKSALVPHQHYRLVLDVIGQSLTKFSSSYEMLCSTLDALNCTCFHLTLDDYSFLTHLGHEDAVKAGVLHRDISIGNILIVNGRGILIDWDLSKRLKTRSSPVNDDRSDKVRQPTRTVSTVVSHPILLSLILSSLQGTWQFMSAALVKDRNAPHTFVDDIESFFYVILWLSLMYSPSSMSPSDLTAFIQTVLDPKQYEGTGGSAKADFLMGRSALRGLTFEGRESLPLLLNNLATLFAARYEPEPSEEEKALLSQHAGTALVAHLLAWKHQERLRWLESHDYVTNLLTRSIQDVADWPDNDHAELQTLVVSERGRKRKTKTGWDLSDRPFKKPHLESGSESTLA